MHQVETAPMPQGKQQDRVARALTTAAADANFSMCLTSFMCCPPRLHESCVRSILAVVRPAGLHSPSRFCIQNQTASHFARLIRRPTRLHARMEIRESTLSRPPPGRKASLREFRPGLGCSGEPRAQVQRRPGNSDNRRNLKFRFARLFVFSAGEATVLAYQQPKPCT